MNKPISFLTLFVAISLVYLISCKKEEIPTLSTSSIANITAISASSGGNVTSDGGAEVTARGVCWSLNANPSISDSKTSDGNGEGQFTSNLTGLAAGSTYHVRAYATNSVGTAYGAELSFTTLGEAPECITQAASNITSTGVTLNGTVNANHASTVVTFQYGPTTDYGQTVTAFQSPVEGSSITNVSVELTGLEEGKTYHYRVVATNQLGTTCGDDVSFTTDATISLSTNPISGVTHNSAVVGGKITADGGSSIISRGVCWSKVQNPTVADDHTIDGSGIGTFTSLLKCLEEQTTYYVRAFAKNGEGTVYGDQRSFTTEQCPITFNPCLTYGKVEDIDGNCYKTIQIGDQVWMAENLRTSRYNDGTPIPNVVGNDDWSNLLKTTIDPIQGEIYDVIGAYCWYDNDSATYEQVYGKLYNWGVVNSGKICPLGWHVSSRVSSDSYPENNECIANEYLGEELMETGSIHWINPYTPCVTNHTGFTAVPSGMRSNDGTFSELRSTAYFYSPEKSGHGPTVFFNKVPHSMYFCSTPMSCIIFPNAGLSIRCVKDN